MRRTVIVAAVLAVLIGCAKEKPIAVAKVGSIEITLEELKKKLPAQEFKSETEELNTKKSVLDQLIEDKLLLLEARNRGYDKEEELQKKLESLRKDASIKHMYGQLIVDKTEASDEDVREMWERLGEEVKARVITLGTKEEADSVLKELKAGTDFERLARENSIDTRSGPKGGDLGYVKWDAYNDEFSGVLFALNTGETSDVVEVKGFYQIVRVEDRRKIEQKPFEEEKELLTEKVTVRKRAEAAQDFIDELKENAAVVFEDEVLSWIEEKAKSQTGDMRAALPELTPEEKEKILVRFTKAEWSIAEVLERFGPRLPPFSNIQSVKSGIEGLITGELLWREAKRRGVHKEKKVEDEVAERVETRLVRTMRREASQTDSKPTDDELLEYYEAYKNQYKDKEFEEVKGRIQMRLVQEQRKQKEKEFIRDLETKYSPEIYEENLLSGKEEPAESEE